MPKSKSKPTRRPRNRATILYGDEPRKGEGGRDYTISRSATTGRVSRNTHVLAIERETGTSINNDSADPWTAGFFDSNTEAFVVDSPPDELPDFDSLESQPEPNNRRTVRMPFTSECSHIDKGS